LKNKEVAQILGFVLLFSHGENNLLIFTKNGLAHILGDFFANASSHPASTPKCSNLVCERNNRVKI
jgi:hypothetical protein